MSEYGFMFTLGPLRDISCELHTSKSILSEPLMGIGLQKNSEYFEVFKCVADAIVGSGHLSKIFTYNIYALKSQETCTSQHSLYIEYSTVSYMFNFLMFFMGMSLLVALVEYVWVSTKGRRS